MEQSEMDAIDAIELSPEEEARITYAIAHARDWYDWEIATSVRYVRQDDLFIILLRSGRRLAIPREDLQGLADAPQALAANVTLEEPGSSLHWEELDTDFSIAGLVQGRYGNERWIQYLEEKYGACTIGKAG